MASNPPSHAMEDQTDEDFFDKLVDDDFGPTNSDYAPKFGEGSDSDEVKAFANLNIEDPGGDGGIQGTVEKDSVSAGTVLSGAHAEESNTGTGLSGAHADESNTLYSSNSSGSGSVVESSNNEISHVSDSMVSKSGGSTQLGVKEVGWNSFHADSVPNGSRGFGSYSDFFNNLGDGSEDFPGKVGENVNVENTGPGGLDNLVSFEQYQDGTQVYGGSVGESINGQDLNSSQYWDSMYPGWKYDANTGQWYQVDGYDASASVEGNFDANSGNDWAAVSDGKTELNYLQQTSQSVRATVTETSTNESVSFWNEVPQGNNNGYPEHMVFDPQYPGWYYDTIAQEWYSLESYTSSIQSTMVESLDQHNQNGFASKYSQNNSSRIYGEYGQANKYVSEGSHSQGQHGSWGESYSVYNHQDANMWQPETGAKTGTVSNFGGNQQMQNSYGSNVPMSNHVDQHKSLNTMGTIPSYGKMSEGHAEANGFVRSQSFVPGGTLHQQFNQGSVKQNEQMDFSNDYYGSQKPATVAQLSFQSNQEISYASDMGRSSAGRPPHALVTFGFGGKLIVMKESSVLNSSFGSQDGGGGSISMLNLMEVILGNNVNASSMGQGPCEYFHALYQQSFPGPLVGGNVGSKELNKWIDERIANCESPDMEYRKGEVLRLLLSLLKIACQHYGKLRSPFGTDSSMMESDCPESAVAKLFASAKNGSQFSEYGAVSQCMQNLPSEGQIRATASEVQNLLVSGRKKEALQCAQEGQLWGPALVLASQLGDQFYVDTVKQMAIRQLVAGSPLRTLCLLIAGQPADVFSSDTAANSGLPGAINMPLKPMQFGANGMLDDWEENLAVITANRTKDDELVLIHLGDCLWKDRSEITAAHICYLVAEANFESYSDSARLCLIGADHWKYPRTYANPEAIQRTELYEYSKVLGNSQFILLPFQPYKLIYAYMLAEVGKVSDSLKYCQAVLKSLKTGRSPEVETWKQLVISLEERIRTHQQGGYTNLAPAKLVGKLLNFFDNTAHRVVGGLPPPIPSTSQASVQGIDHYHQPIAPRVSSSQSAMAMSSLMPSASMEPISEQQADGNRMTMHNRSVSEPDFGRSPRQVDSSKEGAPSAAQGKTSGSVGGSRFGRFGFGSQLLQKTVGLVLRPRSDRQAKLGEKNKFYYDEKLKRWVEEGAEPLAEEVALPPPPTTAAFQNGMSDYNLKSALKSDGSSTNGSPTFKSPISSGHTSGVPPIPTSSNQFSARGRIGVRARYVDTFNQGSGSSTNLFQSPSVPSVKPAVAANAKFFVPTVAPSGEHSMEAIAENVHEDTVATENPSTTTRDDKFRSPSSSSLMPMPRFPSMDDVSKKRGMINGDDYVSFSRRTASWSGSFNDSFSPPKMEETKPLGEALGLPPSSFMPVDLSMQRMPINSAGFGDDLHEVEL